MRFAYAEKILMNDRCLLNLPWLWLLPTSMLDVASTSIMIELKLMQELRERGMTDEEIRQKAGWGVKRGPKSILQSCVNLGKFAA